MDFLIILLDAIQPSQDIIVFHAIAWLAPVLSLALAAGTTIYGEQKKGQVDEQLKQEQEKLMKQQKELGDKWSAESSKDFLDTEAGSSAMKKLNTQLKEQLSIGKNNAVRGGQTSEAQIANKGMVQDSYNKVLNDIVAGGTRYKMNMGDRYGNALQQMMAGNQNWYGGQSAGYGNMVRGGMGTFTNTMGSTNWEDVFA